MTFDNQLSVTKYRIRRFIVTILVAAAIIVVLVSNWFHFRGEWYDRKWLALYIIVIYLIFVVVNYIRDFNYFYFSDDGDMLRIKYFAVRLMSSKANRIEIPKNTFAGYKVKPRFLNLGENLILYQQVKKGIAKYPPISISSLTETEKKKIYASLSRLSPRNS
ncbi:MAG TPA: hypothetical protein VE912_15205 [Bacteroidales bacterium]|nr:hypothetical protein [Bacteroidales bacterium]